MTLEDKINLDIKAAMLGREKEKLEALRAIKSAILLIKTSPDGGSVEAEIKALLKMVKQRKEAAEIYTTQNRQDLALVEITQAAVIEKYLPVQMSTDEITDVIKHIIKQVGAISLTDVGKVMAAASKQLTGKAENKAVSDIVKKLLA